VNVNLPAPNCWEFRRCTPVARALCPAHPDHGRRCWKVTGLRCDGGLVAKRTVEEKLAYCRGCDYYRLHADKF
jgi:hypothetical protein